MVISNRAFDDMRKLPFFGQHFAVPGMSELSEFLLGFEKTDAFDFGQARGLPETRGVGFEKHEFSYVVKEAAGERRSGLDATGNSGALFGGDGGCDGVFPKAPSVEATSRIEVFFRKTCRRNEECTQSVLTQKVQRLSDVGDLPLQAKETGIDESQDPRGENLVAPENVGDSLGGSPSVRQQVEEIAQHHRKRGDFAAANRLFDEARKVTGEVSIHGSSLARCVNWFNKNNYLYKDAKGRRCSPSSMVKSLASAKQVQTEIPKSPEPFADINDGL